jgi:hypothetical protein
MPDDALTEKPPMPEKLRPLAEDAIRRHQRRSAAPDIVTSPTRQDHHYHLSCPYREEDEGLWFALILECFGTRIAEVGQSFMRQLAALCPLVWYEGENESRVDEESLRQALAIVYSLKPRNEAEAALAAQLVAVHFATMKVGKSAGRYDWIPLPTANCLAALVKAYGNGLLTMEKLRGRTRSTRQTFKVEKHVHHHYDEKHVHFAGGGGRKPSGQDHADSELRARARPDSEPSDLAALPGPNTGGHVLPVPCGEGEAGLQDARRREEVRCAEG